MLSSVGFLSTRQMPRSFIDRRNGKHCVRLSQRTQFSAYPPLGNSNPESWWRCTEKGKGDVREPHPYCPEAARAGNLPSLCWVHGIVSCFTAMFHGPGRIPWCGAEDILYMHVCLFSALNLLLFVLIVWHLGPGAHNASAAARDGADRGESPQTAFQTLGFELWCAGKLPVVIVLVPSNASSVLWEWNRMRAAEY